MGFEAITAAAVSTRPSAAVPCDTCTGCHAQLICGTIAAASAAMQSASTAVNGCAQRTIVAWP